MNQKQPTREVYQIRYIHGTEFSVYNTSRYTLRISPNERWVYVISTTDDSKIVNRIPATSILEIKTKMI